jgi:hypothetical protein
MDRRIRPSNGVLLRGLFFFLQKLANYRFSEACCEVGAEFGSSFNWIFPQVISPGRSDFC